MNARQMATRGMAGMRARARQAWRDNVRAHGVCNYCRGAGIVFGGVPGHPQIVDPESVNECTKCYGTGHVLQLRLFE